VLRAAYTSNLTALPMLIGLLAPGMSPSAALAFLISGPITTLSAMATVWGSGLAPGFCLVCLVLPDGSGRVRIYSQPGDGSILRHFSLATSRETLVNDPKLPTPRGADPGLSASER
jgi:hypothetical protein